MSSKDQNNFDLAMARLRNDESPSFYGSGARACAFIAQAFDLCPDLLDLSIWRDFESHVVGIEMVWDDALSSAHDDREQAVNKIKSAEFHLTECGEFRIHAQIPRLELTDVNSLPDIAALLDIPHTKTYLEAMALRASIDSSTQTDLGPTHPKIRL